MRTYQDLIAVGEGDTARANFCKAAVDEFRTSREYREAQVGERYYNKHNQTIEEFQKFLYTLSGRKVDDIFSANYKLKTLFFRRLCQQQIQYVLGNGVKLEKAENKEKLGRDFDFKLQTAAKRAMAGGRAFGFWNLDHLEVFGYADTPAQPGFCPLYSEDTSELMGGIRYWYRYIGDDEVFRCTLYEPDGYTEYKQAAKDAQILVDKPKRAYIKTTIQTAAGGIEQEIESNYPSLPIVQLFANDSHESELVGIRECIDCYDYIKSGLANDIDDTAGFYWTLKNDGGMDDPDLAKFIQRMKSVRAAVVEDGTEAEAHTLQIPTEARTAMLELLRKDIYEDFQALDVNTLSAASKTAQEIKAAYQAQDNKCADFEYYIIDFVQRVLALAGIDDNPTLMWNRVINQAEETSMILQAANYLSDECIIQHLPFLTPEEAIAEIEKRQAEQMTRFKEDEEETEDEEEDTQEEEDDTEDEQGDKGGSKKPENGEDED